MISGLRVRARHAVPLHLIFLLLLFLPAGCGKKGPVQPLKQPLPAAPKELALRQMGMRFVLAWDIPKVNQNGTPLTDLKGFKVLRMRYDLAEDCPECRDTSVLLEEIDLDFLQEVIRRGDRLYFWDTELKPDFGYKYTVVPYNRRNREGAQAQVRRPMLIPPLPPDRLAATAHDRLVRLAWEPAVEDRQGAGLLGYNLYRHKPGEAFPPRPLNREPLMNTAFEDFDVQNGTTYVYAVRTVVSIMDHPVESLLSNITEAVPREGL
jgi:hypothetical protein